MLLATVLLFFLIFASILFFVISSAFLGFLLTKVPFVPTYKYDVKFFVTKLGIKSTDVFFDLGSGDGKVCFLVEQLSGAKTKGFELTWWTYLVSKLKVVSSKSEAQFICGDFFKANWQEANYIYAYLYPPLMARVEEKFLADCRPGSIAIIRDFPFPNLKPGEVFKMPKKHEVYIYKK